MTYGERPDPRVEKLMSITRAEFEAGIARMEGGPARRTATGDYLVTAEAPIDPGIACSFEPQPDVVLGHLLRLPRARVVLHLEALSVAERLDFLDRFDHTFQRGGG